MAMSKTANTRRSAAASRSSWDTLAFLRFEIAVTQKRARLSANGHQVHYRLTEWRHFH